MPIPPNNGAVLNIACIIKHIMSSATEAELAGLYIMATEAVYIRIILEEIGQKQPPTPLQTNNSMAKAVINGKVQIKQTKPWICNSIGYEIKNVNSSSKYTGGQEN
jgi:hypothetical protein